MNEKNKEFLKNYFKENYKDNLKDSNKIKKLFQKHENDLEKCEKKSIVFILLFSFY